MPAKIFPDQLYGELQEGLHVAGYTLERAFQRLESLIAGNDWKKCGAGFKDINEFLSSINLERFRAIAEDRKRIAKRIKQLQPAASTRAIGKTLGADHKTVSQDLGENSPGDSKKANKNKGGSGENSPRLSGEEAAKIAARAERVSVQQQGVNERVEKVALNAKNLGKFSLILADPPWDDEFGKSDRSIENHYPTMKFADILALPVSEIAHDQAMLFLWATPSMIEMALKTSEAWGFAYRTQMVWVKPSIGLGKYVRQRHEILLICRRGDHPAPAPESLPDSVVEAPRGEHSAKPEVFHQIVERMYPDARKIELFRRGTSRDGWAAWGAETQAKAAE
jgi:N6-adenosine-specific RNA methylase IME4